ncbi:hypothetical protein D3C71_1739370 [compost metagenome]
MHATTVAVFGPEDPEVPKGHQVRGATRCRGPSDGILGRDTTVLVADVQRRVVVAIARDVGEVQRQVALLPTPDETLGGELHAHARAPNSFRAASSSSRTAAAASSGDST